jgi:hypothetical protein
MPVVITGSNTPTAGGVTYGDGTTYANTAAGSAGGVLYSAGSFTGGNRSVANGDTLNVTYTFSLDAA